jgi:hypothetical protein
LKLVEVIIISRSTSNICVRSHFKCGDSSRRRYVTAAAETKLHPRNVAARRRCSDVGSDTHARKSSTHALFDLRSQPIAPAVHSEFRIYLLRRVVMAPLLDDQPPSLPDFFNSSGSRRCFLLLRRPPGQHGQTKQATSIRPTMNTTSPTDTPITIGMLNTHERTHTRMNIELMFVQQAANIYTQHRRIFGQIFIHSSSGSCVLAVAQCDWLTQM